MARSHKTYIAIALVSLVLLIGIFIVYKMYSPQQAQATNEGSQWTPIEVTSDNLPSVLESTPIVHDLPDESLISLTIGTSKYKIEKDSVVLGEISNPDVEITLPEKYFSIIGQSGFCSALRIAKDAGDIGISFSGSSASLAWKYRALGKYRSCLGE